MWNSKLILTYGIVSQRGHIEWKLTKFLKYLEEVRTVIIKQEMRTLWPDWAQQDILLQSYMKK